MTNTVSFVWFTDLVGEHNIQLEDVSYGDAEMTLVSKKAVLGELEHSDEDGAAEVVEAVKQLNDDTLIGLHG